MSSSSYNKHEASLSIEEIYQQSNNQQQNWLLTYIDVFVLIIMLVITLMALSDFETGQKNTKTQIIQQQIKPPATLKKSRSNTADIKIPTHPEPSNSSAKNQQKQVPPPPPFIEPKPSQIIQAKKQTPTPKEETIEAENTYKPEVKLSQTDQQQDHPLNEEKIQNQLTKTIEELGLTDAVNMKVTLGYAQLEIQDKILFKSSAATLLDKGATLLKKLIPLLATSSGLIYIEGHTDNRPIKTTAFPSNWELGAARATSVLHYLASQKLNVSRLRAITYGDTKPIADNSTEEGREKNRRVSLVIKVSDKID
jgi:chemotaxis protein MotB